MKAWFGSYRLLASVTGATFLMACGSAVDPNEDPPTLPPDASMVIDFTDFASSSPDVPTSLLNVGINWTRAAASITAWNVALTVTLATPVAAFIAAANQQPQHQGDGSWEWEYNFSVGLVQHSARLVGRFAAPGVQWEMYLTKANEYTDFLWYTGSSNLPATEGQWNVNLHPDNPTAFMRIDWTRDLSANTGDIRYTNVTPGAAENGSFIFYGLVSGTDYDAFYEISNSTNGNATEIEWNRTSVEGRIRADHFYGDTDWHCWDGGLDDVAC